MREHILNYIATNKWLIDDSYLNKSMEFINKALITPELLNTPEMVDNNRNRIVDENGRRQGRDLYIRDGIAILDVTGPIFRYSDIGMCMSTQSTQSIAEDLKMAVENPNIKGIVLNMDTPGGDARGVSELADQIKNAAARKPVYTYIDGYGCSAGYWLASPSDKIYINNTGFAGSIGAVTEFEIKKQADDVERIQVVSSVSPLKRVDFASEEGRALLQEAIDDLGMIFAKSVAENRGVTLDYVLENYGKGGTMMGEKAVNAGLVDQLGTLDSVIEDMRTNLNIVNGAVAPQIETENGGQKSMSDVNTNTEKPVEANSGEPAQIDVDAVKTEAAESAVALEQGRIQSIISTFTDNGMVGHAKMTELISDPNSGELEAVKACNAILMESKTETSLADKELALRAEDSKELEDVQGADLGSEETGLSDSGMDVKAFTAGAQNYLKSGKV